MTEIESLRQHIEQLEYRLDEYHSQLSDAVKERDEVALDAAWGIVQAAADLKALVFGAVIGLIVYTNAKSITSNTIALILGALSWFIAQWILESRWGQKVQSERIKEKEGLPGLPEWKSEAEKLWDN